MFFKKVKSRNLDIQIDRPLGIISNYCAFKAISEILLLGKLHFMTTATNEVFVSRLQMLANPWANERLKNTTPEDYRYDPATQGYWIRRGSSCHSLCLLLGIEPYDTLNWPKMGTWDRTGRIA